MRWKRGNRLKLVTETDAPPLTRQIFDEVRHALGVPVVPFLYQAYAAFPSFLALHWQAFRRSIESPQFFLLGGRLAAEAYTRAHNYFVIRDLRTRPTLAEANPQPQPSMSLLEVLDYYQYLDPLQVLIAAAQVQALEGPVGQESPSIESGHHAPYLRSPALLTDVEAPPAVQRIWDDRRRLVELTAIADEHRALAIWPAFYEDYWRAQRELLQSPLFNDSQYRIGESAWALASELPGPIETGIPQLLDAGLGEEEVSSLARINQMLIHALSGLVLEVVFARIGCEGGTATAPQPPSPESLKTASQGTVGSPLRAA